jgi:HAD superfamily hydrolase (TIGR01509 family)
MPCSDIGPSCVIFDVDGTLTRTNELIFASFNHVAARHLGRTFAPADIIALFGPPEEGALLKVFGPDRLDLIMRELLEFYAAHHSAMASLHRGMEEVLQFLRAQDVRLAVFTGKGRHTTSITLEALGITHYFDFIVTGNDVSHHKPHPEGILRILDRFGVKPGEALMIGDSLSDIAASHGAGVRIASVVWDTYDVGRVRAANPDCLFETVEQILGWFRGLFGNGRMDNRQATT